MLIIPSILILLAFLPAIVLFIFIYKKDVYKEPLNILIWTFIMGMVSAPFSGVFSGLTPDSINAGPFLSALYTAFVKAAFPEELAKFIILYAVIWNNRNFDEMFDGIVYASVVGLGFAALENLQYVLHFGPGVVVSRALLAVPGHFFFGVAMGAFFGIAKFFPQHKTKLLTLSVLTPILIHGCYDFLLMWAEGIKSIFSVVIMLVFYVFIFRMWKFGFRRINALQGR